MAQRTECLYNDEIIGIESIYTVVDGKQINIPEKVESLRQKGRDGLLTCTCGCGTKLTLVAGDNHLREQHFRIQDGSSYFECTLKQEGQISVDSKVVVKCWLSDKLSNNIETRVPLNKIVNNERKYEISHLVRDRKLAINYTNTRLNLNDDKFKEIDNSLKDYSIYHIVDIENSDTNGQYPEFMMKIQNRQHYCLFLEIIDRDYSKARLVSAFYYKNLDGLYACTRITEDKISEYSFNNENKLQYKDKLIDGLLIKSKEELKQKLERDKIARLEEEKKLKEAREKELQIARERAEERRRKQEEYLRQLQQSIEEAHKRLAIEEQERLKQERVEKEQHNRLDKECRDKAEKEIDSYISTKYIDAFGRDWYKCEICGKVGLMKEFGIFGGVNKAARGTCHNCIGKRTENIDFEISPKKVIEKTNFCPECGCELVKRTGKYGDFLGCSSYPSCRYTRKL